MTIDKRPPIFDPVWHALQPNDVGTDEFLTLCKLLGVDPYITVNAGFGDAWSARELVEYTNGAVTTPMGKWRAQNGHPAPYNVKLWGIGNEPWGDYQMGAMALPQYEMKHNLFAKEMKKVDPTITLIAGGAMPDVMEGADQARRINGQYVPDYLSSADWTGQLLLHCLPNIDMVSEHYYASGTMHTDMKLGKKVPIEPPLSFIELQRAAAVQVRAKYEHYEKYLELIPALRAKPVPIAIDEWAYFLPGKRDSYHTVPAYAWAFHEMFRHSDIFQMANLTFATATFSSNGTEAVLNPTGLLFKMYRDHFGVIPVEVSGNSPQPKPAFPAGGDQPAVNPGSPTYPLDVSAALSEDRKTLAIAVLNPSDAEQSIHLDIHGAALASTGKLWRMAPNSDRCHGQGWLARRRCRWKNSHSAPCPPRSRFAPTASTSTPTPFSRGLFQPCSESASSFSTSPCSPPLGVRRIAHSAGTNHRAASGPRRKARHGGTHQGPQRSHRGQPGGRAGRPRRDRLSASQLRTRHSAPLPGGVCAARLLHRCRAVVGRDPRAADHRGRVCSGREGDDRRPA